MLLNEYRLQPWTPQAQQFLVEQMEQFFFGEGSALPRSLFAFALRFVGRWSRFYGESVRRQRRKAVGCSRRR